MAGLKESKQQLIQRVLINHCNYLRVTDGGLIEEEQWRANRGSDSQLIQGESIIH